MTKCSIRNCERPYAARTYCSWHYRKKLRHGKLDGVPYKRRPNGKNTRKGNATEYDAWRNMINRCTKTNSPNYKYYGARGISVCDAWLNSFDAFLESVGKKPEPHLSLERINNDLGYQVGNVKWATPTEQANNRRKRGSAIIKLVKTRNKHVRNIRQL